MGEALDIIKIPTELGMTADTVRPPVAGRHSYGGRGHDPIDCSNHRISIAPSLYGHSVRG